MLKQLIDGKRVALIGPSPHLINSNNGDFIDSFDTVIRINELGVSKSLYSDYGAKTNVAFLTLTEQSVPVYKKMIQELDLHSLNLIVHPRDKLNFNPYEKTYSKNSSSEYFKELNLDVDLFQIEKPSFEERCIYFNSFLQPEALQYMKYCSMILQNFIYLVFLFIQQNIDTVNQRLYLNSKIPMWTKSIT